MWGADQLIKALKKFGYSVDDIKGSHIRITTQQNGEYHETIPNHNPLKVGPLSAILNNIAKHHNMTVESLSQLDL